MSADQSQDPVRNGPPGPQPRAFAALLGALFVVCFATVWLGWETFGLLDFGQFACPVANYSRESFWRGEVPLWNPLSECGLPFLAQWNTMCLYPLSLFYLVAPFPWGVGVFSLLHLVGGGLGMYFLARRWTRQPLAGAVAGVAFAFNGFSWYALMWPHLVAALAWMPWLVLALERALREGGRWVVWAALAAAAQLLSGGAEVIALTWALAGLLAGVELTQARVKWKEKLARFLAAGVLGAGVAAAQLLPFLDLLVHSQRGADYVTSLGAMPLTGWANYLVPLFHCLPNAQRIFVQPDQWVGSYYLGLGVLALAAVAVWRIKETRIRLLAGAALLALLLAMGDAGGVYTLARRLCPLLGFLRFTVKFVIVITFVAPLLAGCGLAWILERSECRQAEARQSLWRVAAVLGGLVAGVILLSWLYQPQAGIPVLTTMNGLVRLGFLGLVGAAVALLCRRDLGQLRPLLAGGLLVVLWFDIFTHNGNLSPTVPTRIFEPGSIRQYFKWDERLSAGQQRLMQSRSSFHDMMRKGYNDLQVDTLGRRLSQFFDFNLLDQVPKVDGFYSLELRSYRDLAQELYWGRAEASGLLRFAGVALVSNPTNLVDWVEQGGAQPLVTAGRTPRFAAESEVLRQVESPGWNPAQVIYLPAEAASEVTATGREEARIVAGSFSAHQVEFGVEASAPTVVSLAQSYYHCWHAYVDGRPVKLWRANYAFQGLEVPGGQHRVVLRYEDDAFRHGLELSVLSLLALAGLWGWNGGKQKAAKRG